MQTTTIILLFNIKKLYILNIREYLNFILTAQYLVT